MWFLPSLNLDNSVIVSWDVSQKSNTEWQTSKIKIKNRMANSVNPDETDLFELSHQDLHCLQKYTPTPV